MPTAAGSATAPASAPSTASSRTGARGSGNWASRRFNLPALVCTAIPEIQGRTTLVLMHNDAVVQGLSELPRMRDVKRWGALTIGTGLGNARFTNRRKKD